MREGLPDNNVCVCARRQKWIFAWQRQQAENILALSRAERIHLGRLIDNANTMGWTILHLASGCAK